MQNDQAVVDGNNQGTPPIAEQTQTLNSPAQVEGAGNAPEANGGDGKAFDVQKFFVNNKRVTDGLRSELRELKEIVTKAFQPPAQTQPPSAHEPQGDIWTNPDAYIEARVQKALESKLDGKLALNNLARDQEKAEAYILSQDYIDTNSEADRAELQKIFQERGFTQSWNSNPFAAAEGILEIYRARKGIGKSTPPRVQAGAVLSGSAPDANGKRTWTSRDVAALSAQDYEKFRPDIETAVKEGRYRE